MSRSDSKDLHPRPNTELKMFYDQRDAVTITTVESETYETNNKESDRPREYHA